MGLFMPGASWVLLDSAGAATCSAALLAVFVDGSRQTRKTESWSFTEIDQTFSAGIGIFGRMWKRNNDRAGIAFASNGISHDHALYLAYGGLGFVLGDGGLKYGRENPIEGYYTAHIWRGIYLGPDLQYIVNPGYDQLRGPVLVPSFRLHVEL